MSRLSPQRILLIGDVDRQMHAALAQAMPGASVTSVGGYFDGVAELVANPYTAVLAAAEPIERRPEAAVRTLRELAGDGRVVLFGHPTLEPLSRKMLNFGADDYVVSPTTPGELEQVLGAPTMRLAAETPGDATDGEPPSSPPEAQIAGAAPTAPGRTSLLLGLPLVDIFLDALLKHPHDAPGAAIKQLNARLAPAMELRYDAAPDAPPPPAGEGRVALSAAVRSDKDDLGALHLLMPRDEDDSAGRHFLSQLAHRVGKVAALQDRHNRLQKLAITDDLTGLYNGRYFRHFLARIVERARTMRFPVTLLLFDIDNFKKYNDQYGHGVGDEILRQTAALMKRCCRDHDLVARISGDEFAVVFWEKEGPRQPRDPKAAPTPSRLPQTPQQILERFRRLLRTQDFRGLGPSGQGLLTISGGLAVFPYDATEVDTLITAADRALMFHAKQEGKNSIALVGDPEPLPPPDEGKP